MTMRRAKRIAKAIDMGVGIARDLFEDQIANARKQLRPGMGGVVLRSFLGQPSDICLKRIKDLGERGGPIELPAMSFRECIPRRRHSVTSSGITSSSETVIPAVNAWIRLTSASVKGRSRSGCCIMSRSRNDR